MSVTSRDCPECGAPLAPGADRCEYCGSWIERSKETPPAEFHAPAVDAAKPGKPKPDRDAGDFGFRSRTFFLTCAAIALVIYAIGWVFEDTQYWLDDRAIAVWAGILPFWLCIAAFFWRPRWGGWLAGFLFAIPIFAVHTAIPCAIRGRIQDDYVGIAAMFAGAVLGGWLLGRIFHSIVHWARRRSPARVIHEGS